MRQVEKVMHKKMYKAGKFWVATGVTFLATSVISGVHASADTAMTGTSSDTESTQAAAETAAVASNDQTEVTLGTTPAIAPVEGSEDGSVATTPVSDTTKTAVASATAGTETETAQLSTPVTSEMTQMVTDTPTSDSPITPTDSSATLAAEGVAQTTVVTGDDQAKVTRSADVQSVQQTVNPTAVNTTAGDTTNLNAVTDTSNIEPVTQLQPVQQSTNVTIADAASPLDTTKQSAENTTAPLENKTTVTNSVSVEATPVQNVVATASTTDTNAGQLTEADGLPATTSRPATEADRLVSRVTAIPADKVFQYTVSWGINGFDFYNNQLKEVGEKTFSIHAVGMPTDGNSGTGTVLATTQQLADVLALHQQLIAEGYTVFDPLFERQRTENDLVAIWDENTNSEKVYENLVGLGTVIDDGRPLLERDQLVDQWWSEIVAKANVAQYDNIVNYVDESGTVLGSQRLPVIVKVPELTNLVTGETIIPDLNNADNRYNVDVVDESANYVNETGDFFVGQDGNSGTLDSKTGDESWTVDLPKIDGYTNDQTQATFTSNIRDGQKVFTVTYHKVPSSEVTPDAPTTPTPSETTVTPDAPVDVTPTLPAAPDDSVPAPIVTTPTTPVTPGESVPSAPVVTTPQTPVDVTPGATPAETTPAEVMPVTPGEEPITKPAQGSDAQRPAITSDGNEAVNANEDSANDSVAATIASVNQPQRSNYQGNNQRVGDATVATDIVPTTAGVVPTLMSVIPTTASIVPTTGNFANETNQLGVAPQPTATTVLTSGLTTVQAPAKQEVKDVKQVEKEAKSADNVEAAVAGTNDNNKTENNTASSNDDLIKILSALALGSMGLFFFILWRRKRDKDEEEER